LTTLAHEDRERTVARYAGRYRESGYSPETLGWIKGKQDIRFEVLTAPFDCRGKTVLDIGCGFGDLNHLLRERCGEDYRYIGNDLVPDLLAEARERYGGPNVTFVEGDFLSTPFDCDVDIAVSSGIFNHRLEHTDSYSYIEAVLAKAFAMCREGLAFDFLSDKVDFRHEHTFHSSPERILGMAYALSRNVLLRNDYMPFEFSLFVFKDGSFSKVDTLFERFKRLRG